MLTSTAKEDFTPPPRVVAVGNRNLVNESARIDGVNCSHCQLVFRLIVHLALRSATFPAPNRRRGFTIQEDILSRIALAIRIVVDVFDGEELLRNLHEILVGTAPLLVAEITRRFRSNQLLQCLLQKRKCRLEVHTVRWKRCSALGSLAFDAGLLTCNDNVRM